MVVLGTQRCVLLLEGLVRLQQHREVALDAHAPLALGIRFQLTALEAPLGIADAVLQQPLQPGFGVAFEPAPPLDLVEAAIAVAEDLFQRQTQHGEDRRHDGAAADTVPDGFEIMLHSCCVASKVVLGVPQNRPVVSGEESGLVWVG
jgi:hypothetical protein